MGYDISYHPVDLAFLHRRVLPFVLGQGSLDDLNQDMLRLVKVRHRANAWGLGCSSAHSNLMRGTSGGQATHSAAQATAATSVELETMLHIWGRPLFITADCDEVSQYIDRYMAVQSIDDVDVIAREMIKRLGPDYEQVEPNEEDGLPPDDEIIEAVRWKMDLMREAVKCYREGTMVSLPDGEEVEPGPLIVTDFALAAMEFMSLFRPGWMDRGYAFPSFLFDVAELETDIFESFELLIEPMVTEIPELKGALEPSITSNYMVGGTVRPERVPSLLTTMRKNEDKLLQVLKDEGWEQWEATVTLQKQFEAISDAAQRGMAFAEATEIYSGPMGQMN